MKHFGKIQKGKIVFDNKAEFLDSVGRMEDGVRVVIEIREAENVRTNQQNKLWWSWMSIIADELGYGKQEIHDICKYRFLLREEMIDGEIHQSLKSTTTFVISLISIHFQSRNSGFFVLIFISFS